MHYCTSAEDTDLPAASATAILGTSSGGPFMRADVAMCSWICVSGHAVPQEKRILRPSDCAPDPTGAFGEDRAGPVTVRFTAVSRGSGAHPSSPLPVERAWSAQAAQIDVAAQGPSGIGALVTG